MIFSLTNRGSWIFVFSVLSLLILSLACCGPEENGKNGGKGTVDDPAGDSPKDYERPANMIAALEKGKAEDKLVLVELYDDTCNFCVDMDRVLKKKPVIEALSKLVHVRITVEDEGVIEHFGLTQSPSYLFFKPDGTFLGNYLDGYRPSKRFVAEIENFQRIARGESAVDLGNEKHPNFQKG